MSLKEYAQRINRHYADKIPAAPDRTDIATHAANTRWKGRGGPSAPIRISSELVNRLYAAVPQPERRPFVEQAISSALDDLGAASPSTPLPNSQSDSSGERQCNNA